MNQLFDFSRPGSVAGWLAIDDIVMGGISHSLLQWHSPGFARFSGEVRPEHGGGFASVRSPEITFPDADRIALRVRGDGKTYKLNLRTRAMQDRVSWQAEFATADGELQEVILPLSAFAPRHRGQAIADAPPLRAADICTIGLLIARNFGPFRLDLFGIAACRAT